MGQEFVNPLVEFHLGHAGDASVKSEVILCAQPLIEAGMFQQRTGASANLGGLRTSIEAEYLGLPGTRFDKAQQQPDGRRLACAIGTKETKYGSRRNLKREIVKRANCPKAPSQ